MKKLFCPECNENLSYWRGYKNCPKCSIPLKQKIEMEKVFINGAPLIVISVLGQIFLITPYSYIVHFICLIVVFSLAVSFERDE